MSNQKIKERACRNIDTNNISPIKRGYKPLDFVSDSKKKSSNGKKSSPLKSKRGPKYSSSLSITEANSNSHALVKWIEAEDKDTFTVVPASYIIKDDVDDKIIIENEYKVKKSFKKLTSYIY